MKELRITGTQLVSIGLLRRPEALLGVTYSVEDLIRQADREGARRLHVIDWSSLRIAGGLEDLHGHATLRLRLDALAVAAEHDNAAAVLGRASRP